MKTGALCYIIKLKNKTKLATSWSFVLEDNDITIITIIEGMEPFVPSHISIITMVNANSFTAPVKVKFLANTQAKWVFQIQM